MINVTKSYLPPLKEYVKYLEKIWDKTHLTNFGPLSVDLETKLKKHLGVKYLFFVSNGTIALQIALKALDLKKEIITTPFTYVATTSSIVWENCTPIFADIDPETLCIDPASIESKITKNTQAILAVHVYGNSCNVKEIRRIAKKHNLKVIYDAAHAFDVEKDGKSVLNFGDISTISFHATKLFHTIEGGAIATNDAKLADKIFHLRNFGHVGSSKPETIASLGINGKNSEFHAAMGLCILPRIRSLISSRKKIAKRYDKLLGKKVKRPDFSNNSKSNYSYYPIIFESEKQLLRVKNALNDNDIFPRRYFYPSLNMLSYVKKCRVPVSENISKRILCIPIYPSLPIKEVDNISSIIIKNL